MKLHTKGPKVGRDREYALGKYRELTDFFWWKRDLIRPDEMAGMSPATIYQMAEDFFNSLSIKQKQRYCEHFGYAPRSNPTAFGWFLSDLLRFSRKPKIWSVISSPFRYPGFVMRYNKNHSSTEFAPTGGN